MTGYADAAADYFARGWQPLPVFGPGKGVTPKGYTGYHGQQVTAEDVAEWSAKHPAAGLCLRLVGVVGLDLDAYADNGAGDAWEALCARLGPLEPTWLSSSRLGKDWDGLSGIRLFALPSSLQAQQQDAVWKGNLGPGIDVIRFAHRQVNAYPKVHPTRGTVYCWLDEATGEIVEGVIPVRPEDLPMLPPAWAEELLKPTAEQAKHQQKPAAGKTAGGNPAQWWTPGDPCPAVQKALGEVLAEFLGSPHDTTVQGTLRLTRLGEQGHRGVAAAMDELHTEFINQREAKAFQPEPPEQEWQRAVDGIWPEIMRQGLTPPDRVRCCGPAPEDEVDRNADGLWERSSRLAHIRQFALATRAAPEAVLFAVLARVAMTVPPHVRIETGVDSPASLNLFTALVGVSGRGKGRAERAAKRAVELPCEVYTAPLGSGEGLTHQYVHRDKKGDIVWDRNAVLFSESEVQNLAALGSRQGSTLDAQLRKAYMAEQLGFAYVALEKRLILDEHAYRLCLLLGLQPENGHVLLNSASAAGGTPQRFAWAWTNTTEHGSERPPLPPPLMLAAQDWAVPLALPFREFVVADEVKAEVDALDLEASRGDSELDGHSLLTRVKLAAALAVLHDRQEVAPWEWETAGLLMRRSDRTRAEVVRRLGVKDAAGVRAQGRVRAEQAVQVEESLHASRLKSACTAVLRAVKNGRGSATRKQIKGELGSRLRGYLDEALGALAEAGKVHEEDGQWVFGPS